MTVSLILTINNRPPEVSSKVAESLKLTGNEVDEIIVVLDRPTEEAKLGSSTYLELMVPEGGPTVRYVDIDGDPGWKGPAKAWNAGINAATGDFFYCISSETVQDQGNVAKARALCEDKNTVVFGACHNSVAKDLVVGADPGLLVSSKMCRPLGFIVCMPAWAVREIKGYDEKFSELGFWYDDDDFFLRLWRTGVKFVFEDDIHGIHLDHERPDLATPEGQAGIQRNAAYMMEKHGTLHPWPTLPKVVEYGDGRTVWRHV